MFVPMKFLLSTLLIFIMIVSDGEGTPLPDEHSFLSRPFDFSPPEEQALDAKWIEPPSRPYPFAQAKLEEIKGVRTIVIDGEPMPSWSRASKVPMEGMSVERQMREAGIKLFVIDVNLTAEGEKLGDRRLASAPEPAFEEFRERADRLLKAVPDAKIIVRLWALNVASDYVELYPQAVLQGPEGQSDWGWGYYYAFHHQRPNMLNEWRRYVAEHLSRFIHRLGSSQYAPSVGGFYLAAMNSGEWWYYKGKGDPGWDYSPGRRDAFRRLALAKYGSEAAAAEVWGVANDQRLFELPSLEERRGFPVMPGTKSADYLQTLNLPITQAALYFGRVIKAVTHGKALSGMEIHASYYTAPNNGTVFLDHLLRSPDIDLLGGPSAYEHRRPGSSPLYRVAARTVADHGKLWWNEGDYRTHLAFGTPTAAAGEPPADARSMREVLRREFARGAVFDYATYLMDFGWQWFYDPTVTESLSEIVEADALIRRMGRKRRADVAVVTDQESQLYASYYSTPVGYMNAGILDRIGVGWDSYGLDDFLRADRKDDYRMVIFLNLRALTDAERNGIAAWKSQGRVLLWMHDPGVIDLSSRGRSAQELISELTGIAIREGELPEEVHLMEEGFKQAGLELPTMQKKTFDQARAKLFHHVSPSDAAEGRIVGDHPSPFHAEDSDAISCLEDEQGRSYLAIRHFPQWTSVYTALCTIDPSLLRQLARKAGAFLYHDGDDVFFGGGNIIALHASSDGEKKIALPHKSDLYDLFAQELVAENASSITLTMRKGETRAFYLGEGKAVLAEAEKITRERRQERQQFVERYPAPEMHASSQAWFPQAPASGEERLLEGYAPPVMVMAGPFARDEATMALLDQQLAQWNAVMEWRPLPKPAEGGPVFGTTADRFLHVTRPMALKEADLNVAPWWGLEPANRWGAELSWLSDYRFGMATGQSYVGAFLLSAREAVECSLYLAVEGEARMWIDGMEVPQRPGGEFERTLTATPEKKLVVFRVRGGSKPTGLTLKVAAAQRGRESYEFTHLKIQANPDSLGTPPAGILISLPGRQAE